MAFTGLTSDEMFTAANNAEDVSPTIALLSPTETPFLDWIGFNTVTAMSTKHEFLEEELRPNAVVTAGVMASATANTGVQLADFGDLLTVGTILENTNSTPEVMRVVSIAGPTSVLLARGQDAAGTIGSLTSGTTLRVRGAYGLEGDDHPRRDVSRPRRRKTTPIGLFHIPIAISGTQQAIDVLGNVTDEYEKQKNLRVLEAIRDYEKELIHGNAVNSTQTSTSYRGVRGLRADVTSINSTVVATSFAADPHLYIGNIHEQCFNAGASTTEEWGILAGTTFFRNISDLNTSKVQDSNQSELFKRVIRDYAGPFGNVTVMLSRWLAPTELYLVPRNRIKPVVLQGRSFQHLEMGRTGDSRQGLIVGEYGVEIHHAYAMARLRV